MDVYSSVYIHTDLKVYNLKVKYIRGKENQYAGILLRWKVCEYSNDQRVVLLRNCQWESVDPHMFMPNLDI